MFKFVLSLLACIFCCTSFCQIPDSAQLTQFHFRFIGPDGNRAIAVAGEPGNPMVAYVGAASGGIFKTTDGGVSWTPIFDQQDNSSIGALAIAPSDNAVVWAGTGESFLIRPAHAIGNGVYKSVDSGRTWVNMGLQPTARISRVIIDPHNSNVVYVAALGNTNTPQQERGVYKTTDGGKSWTRVLFVDENTGCSDLSIDPQHPDTLYAAMWQIDIKTWKLSSGGPGSGIYKTTDGGATWKPLRNGLPGGPDHPVGKTSVDVAVSSPGIVYALIEDKTPGLYKSEDAGEHWTLLYQNNSMAQRAPYYTRVRVSPQDPNRLYTICVTIMQSNDGGKTFNGNGNYRPGGDNHDMWFDPTNAKRIMVAHDGCLNMTLNDGKTWQNFNLPIAQMYHVSVDNQVPYFVYGNRQDGYSYRGPSNSLQGNIPLGLWTGVGGCESGYAQPDPVDNNIVWSGCYDGGLDVFDIKTGHAHDVRAWPEAAYGWTPADLKYRWHWNFPLTISTHNHNKVLIGSQFVHQTTDGGQHWTIISPDLTTNDKSHQQNSGGTNSDNLMTFDGCTLFSIIESPLREGLIWTGSNDGQVNLTKDGGKNWTNITANITGLPKWGTISNIEPSAFDEGTAYISVDLHQVGDFNPYIYKTADYGQSWKVISSAIPKSNAAFVHQVKEDPAQKGLLWAGTDNALYFSPDDGIHWIHLKNDLPPSPIYGIVIQKNFSDLVLATFGRGFYILDDITPFRQLSAAVQQEDAHLFTVKKAYRFQPKNGIHSEASFITGENPHYGTAISYFLKQAAADTPYIIIRDEQGATVKKMKGHNLPGVNRVWWNLSYEPLEAPALRTKPRGLNFVKLDAVGKRAMYIYDLDVGPGLTPPLVPPGAYTVELKIGDKIYKEPVEVLKDPNTTGSMADILLQHQLAMKLYNNEKTCFRLIDEMETIRAALLQMVDSGRISASRKKQAVQMEELLWQLEGQVHDIYQTGARQDAFRNPDQLLEQFLAMSKEAAISSADAPPTSQDAEVYELLDGRLQKVLTDYNKVKSALQPYHKDMQGLPRFQNNNRRD